MLWGRKLKTFYIHTWDFTKGFKPFCKILWSGEYQSKADEVPILEELAPYTIIRYGVSQLTRFWESCIIHVHGRTCRQPCSSCPQWGASSVEKDKLYQAGLVMVCIITTSDHTNWHWHLYHNFYPTTNPHCSHQSWPLNPSTHQNWKGSLKGSRAGSECDLWFSVSKATCGAV